MSAVREGTPKTTVRTLQAKRDHGERIVVVTAYDHPGARAADAAGVDVVLVGDSLAMVVLGYDSTLPVTMDEMLHHARAVARGAARPLLVGDMPFMSFQAGPADALRNAARFLKEAGMDAVKLEGGRRVAATVATLVEAGIPVMGHVGLTPQSVHALGGYRVQGKTRDAARALLADALALEEAGAFAIVLESVPSRLAAHVTERLRVPTIGIGAGPGTSGQVLVLHDLLGLTGGHQPRFVRRFAEVGAATARGLAAYRDAVADGSFPGPEHGYEMPDAEWEAFLAPETADANETADAEPPRPARLAVVG